MITPNCPQDTLALIIISCHLLVQKVWHAALQIPHWCRSSASLLTASYLFSLAHSFISSSHIRLGRPCAVAASNVPSNIWSVVLSLDPPRTWPVKDIFCFRIFLLLLLTVKYDTNVIFTFEKHQDCRSRGHNLKLANHRCHYDLRKYFLHTNNKSLQQFARIYYLCQYHRLIWE